MIEFDVVGLPVPKGSMKGFVPGWRQSQITQRSPRVVLTSTTKGLPAWTALVRYAAICAQVPKVDAGPVTVGLVFRLPPPDAIRKSGKPRPPHCTRPDLDKLIRAVLDAITGVGWHDDNQVAEIRASKRYTLPLEEPGVKVYIVPAHTAP